MKKWNDKMKLPF